MSERKSPILVTGAAGFIGYHVCERLLKDGEEVLGVDNLNHYYDVKLKEARLDLLRKHAGFRFELADVADRSQLNGALAATPLCRVIHLAAQAGVRYSLKNPHAYTSSNVTGFINLLEACRKAKTEHFVFASSSSIYGGNTKMPWSEHENVDHPISLYAATKKAGELMAHSYAHLFGLPVTCLRFFSVYGPWGRPDMSYYTFTASILEGKPIEIYNEGKMTRDFTYVDDVVEGVVRVLARPPKPDNKFDSKSPDPATSWAPWRVYNIGNDKPVSLLEYVDELEKALGKKAVRVMKPAQPGDILATHADITDLKRDFGFQPKTPLAEGLRRFTSWYRSYHGA